MKLRNILLFIASMLSSGILGWVALGNQNTYSALLSLFCFAWWTFQVSVCSAGPAYTAPDAKEPVVSTQPFLLNVICSVLALALLVGIYLSGYVISTKLGAGKILAAASSTLGTTFLTLGVALFGTNIGKKHETFRQQLDF